ncbi:hypothetical protein SUGI_0478880 [Cryptomeria japonica]|uniref:NAC domain-containing protein 22 n=1 Tax=Cryptomeria japonica TaxID=3369 RepID=UPI002408BEA4|nr:NAC domain-containing protein 22 [Cryptomeria japonica]GLJ25017.1 hypothetical protein SUGI_0478880 [Cryptomeria japonica]
MEGRLHGEFDLPGFRFHPTEEELVGFYLRKRIQGQSFSFDIIGTLDLYRYDPWELPDLSFVGEGEWFFFVPVDKKCAQSRRSRLTRSGYWKATGTDKPVRDTEFQCIGLKKTLVFYRGKAPTGEKTDWIMNEYRMPDFRRAKKKDLVLCRIYRKATPQKTLDQRAMSGGGENPIKFSAASNSFDYRHDFNLMNHETGPMGGGLPYLNKTDGEDLMEYMSPFKDDKVKLPELQVPMVCVDKLFSQSNMSPWIDNTSWTPSILLCTPKGEWNNN